MIIVTDVVPISSKTGTERIFLSMLRLQFPISLQHQSLNDASMFYNFILFATDSEAK
jgi:hypothetical protein